MTNTTVFIEAKRVEWLEAWCRHVDPRELTHLKRISLQSAPLNEVLTLRDRPLAEFRVEQGWTGFVVRCNMPPS